MSTYFYYTAYGDLSHSQQFAQGRPLIDHLLCGRHKLKYSRTHQTHFLKDCNKDLKLRVNSKLSLLGGLSLLRLKRD
jgi:hypothetical protein